MTRVANAGIAQVKALLDLTEADFEVSPTNRDTIFQTNI